MNQTNTGIMNELAQPMESNSDNNNIQTINTISSGMGENDI